MFPVEFYRAVQADRHARLGRLLPRARRRVPATGHPAPARPPERPVRVAGPAGEVALTSRGVTLLGPPREAARRH